MNISVVTTVWNRAEQMKYGLLSLLSQTVVPNELIVVDDGSTDHIKEVIQHLIIPLGNDKNCRVIYKRLEKEGARISSYPRNVGLRIARGELVFFVESECLHIGNTLMQLTQKLMDKPRSIAMAGQIWTMGQKVWNDLHDNNPVYLEEPERLLHHSYAQLTDSSNMENKKAPDSDWGITGSNNCFAGCFFGGFTKDFMKVRGFDESFTGHGYDDWDILERLKLYGSPYEMYNDVVVIHQWHEKNYPYNIYEHAQKNGEISKQRLAMGQYGANRDNDNWGL